AREARRCVVTGLETFHQKMEEARAGDNVGALLRGVKRDEVERGQVLARPGSITPHTKFEAQVYVLKGEEGGRHSPFFTGYRPQGRQGPFPSPFSPSHSRDHSTALGSAVE